MVLVCFLSFFLDVYLFSADVDSLFRFVIFTGVRNQLACQA